MIKLEWAFVSNIISDDSLNPYISSIIEIFKKCTNKSMYKILFIFLQSFLFKYYTYNSEPNNMFVAHLYSYLNFINSYLLIDDILLFPVINAMLDAYYNYFYIENHINDKNKPINELLTNEYCNNDDYFVYFRNKNNTDKNMNKILNIIIKIINIFKTSTLNTKNNIKKHIKLLEVKLKNTNTMCNLIYYLRCIYFNKDHISDNMKFFSFMYMFIKLYRTYNIDDDRYRSLIIEYINNLFDNNFNTDIFTSEIMPFYEQKLLDPHNNS